ncbi:MAG: hypothetical protein ACLF0G_14175 [Candidatus Brocadiia bacterium]
MRRTALLACALGLLAAGALAGEADDGGAAVVSEDEIDKPSRPGVRPPKPLSALTEGEEPEDKDEQAAETKPRNPFRGRARKPSYAVPARVTYSDGTVLQGWVWRGTDQPIRIFNRAERAHEDYFLSELKRIDVKPETQNFERDWRWKNQGSSVKVFLDTGYLWNQYVTTFTTVDGEKVSGDCSGQFYIITLDGEKKRWFLYKRHSGRDRPHKKQAELEPLVYVKSVEFTDEILEKPDEKDEEAEPQDEGEAPAPEKK